MPRIRIIINKIMKKYLVQLFTETTELHQWKFFRTNFRKGKNNWELIHWCFSKEMILLFKRMPRGRTQWLAALLLLLKTELPWILLYLVVLGTRFYVARKVTNYKFFNALFKKNFKSMEEVRKEMDVWFLRIIAVLSMIFSYYFIMWMVTEACP